MSITLVNIGNINTELLKLSIEKTADAVPVDKIKVFTDKPFKCSRDIEFIDLPVPYTRNDVSNFYIKGLLDYIDTDFVLMVQYDGFGVNGQYWTDEYLKYDFIGTATPRDHHPLRPFIQDLGLYDKSPHWWNGGGGISLRSVKLLRALSDYRIVDEHYCEDVAICFKYRELLEKHYGINFAPLLLTLQFGIEGITGYNYCLGFHGYENIPMFLSEEETIFYINNVDRIKRCIPSVRKFIANCCHQDYNYAVQVFNNRIMTEFQ